jgi:hypothetical protein
MEIAEEFTELVADLNRLTDGLNIKKLKENKEEMHAVLESMTELLDELDMDEDELDE